MVSLVARLGRLEQEAEAAREARDRRFRQAGHALLATMDPEHVAMSQAWHERPEVQRDFREHPHDEWPKRARRLKPPALVRAMYELAAMHLDDGRPPDLPPVVAQAYLRDEAAYARDECKSCRYRGPVYCPTTDRGGRLVPTGTYFDGCALCGSETTYSTWRSGRGWGGDA